MKPLMRNTKTNRFGLLALLLWICGGALSSQTLAAVDATQRSNTMATTQAYVPFEGERTAWHDGFDRYDFIMDGATLAITPFKGSATEGFGIREPTSGNRRCVVICPKQPAPGNPWSWRGCYWDHQPQTEIELLRRGFHI